MQLMDDVFCKLIVQDHESMDFIHVLTQLIIYRSQ